MKKPLRYYPPLLSPSHFHSHPPRLSQRVHFTNSKPPPASSNAFVSPTPVEIHLIRLDEEKAANARRQRRLDRRAEIDKSETTKGSLIDETLREMDAPDLVPSSREARRDLRKLGSTIPSFTSFLSERNLKLERNPRLTTFQINIGLYCNQACAHCHVESSPRRVKEQMNKETVDRCIYLIKNSACSVVDVTGGAPELNANFRYLVESLRSDPATKDVEIIDRCNLTVLGEPGQEDLAEFLARRRVRVVASLPCYGPTNVDKQRGKGVFDRSISALLTLNELGYGTDPNLKLDLVYNPLGAFLPPDQSKLEAQYRKELDASFGIVFTSLFCITNMPIKRFADHLHHRGEFREYMDLLVRSFNPEAVKSVMCTDYVSVSHDGKLYDCDFNQQLGMPISVVSSSSSSTRRPMTVFDLENVNELRSTRIATGTHCFGCTAGKGSSCKGEVV